MTTLTLKTNKLIFFDRATDLIVAACGLTDRRVVLLPALYCADVAIALEAMGFTYRCYDIDDGLYATYEAIDSAYTADVGSVVILHPFGLSRKPPDSLPFGDAIVIEDACHSLRTACKSSDVGAFGDITIFSPRKELGWAEGGFAAGTAAGRLTESRESSSRIRRKWEELGVDALVSDGRRATELAVEVLGDYLPLIGVDDVLTALPLKSAARDGAIAQLRADGIHAWRWIQPLKTSGKLRTPQSYDLRKRLFLVPLPSEVSRLEYTLKRVWRLPLERWRCYSHPTYSHF